MTNKKRFISIFITCLLFLVFAVLSVLVHYDFFRQIDYHSMLGVQKISLSVIDYLFSLFTILGSSESVLLLILSIFVLLYYRKKKFIFAVFLYVLIYPIELMGKLLIYHPVPPVFLNRYIFDFHLPSSFIVQTSYSYPSGNMARSAYLVSLLFFLAKKSKLPGNKKRIIYIVLGLYLMTMFISRIYLGEHWFSDVLGGTILGFGVSLLTQALW